MNDERVSSITAKVCSRATSFFLMALLVDVVYRFFYLQQTISEFLDLIIIFWATFLYVNISLTINGAYTNKRKLNSFKKNLAIDFAYIILSMIVFVLITGVHIFNKLIIALLIIFAIRFLPILLSKISDSILEKSIED